MDHDNVRPDVVILGKALSGGLYPVSKTSAFAVVQNSFVPPAPRLDLTVTVFLSFSFLSFFLSENYKPTNVCVCSFSCIMNFDFNFLVGNWFSLGKMKDFRHVIDTGGSCAG